MLGLSNGVKESILKRVRVFSGEAGVTEVFLLTSDTLFQSFQTQVIQGSCMDKFLNFLNLMGGGNQFRFLWRINTEEAGVGDGRGTDPDMDLLGAGVSKHRDDLPAGCGAHNGVIHNDDLLPR